jgi:hypothetical protein
MTPEVSPLPSLDENDPMVQQLRQMRRQATEALTAAEAAEKEASRLRRNAKSRIRAYEKLVAEYNGQLRLFSGDRFPGDRLFSDDQQ